MSQKKSNFFQSINPKSANFDKSNALIFILLLSFLFSSLTIFILIADKHILALLEIRYESQKRKIEGLEQQIKPLQKDSVDLIMEIDSLLDETDLLELRLDRLLVEKDSLMQVNDSLQNLFYY